MLQGYGDTKTYVCGKDSIPFGIFSHIQKYSYFLKNCPQEIFKLLKKMSALTKLTKIGTIPNNNSSIWVFMIEIYINLISCTGCPKKHGNSVTNSISSLL